MSVSTQVELQTSHGAIVLELDEDKAPESSRNFLRYVDSGHYDGTVFHRVIKGFMVQGGGFAAGMKQKPTAGRIAQRGQQRSEERPLHGGDGAHVGTAFGHFAILHQHDRQRLPQLQVGKPAGLGLCRVRARRRRKGRGRRHRAGEDRQERGPWTTCRSRTSSSRRPCAWPESGGPVSAGRPPLPACETLIAPPPGRRIDFISDLHLSEDTPDTFRAWARHLNRTEADAVFILGDLFEVWVGDDARFDAFEARCAQVLSAASERRAIAFMAGNRDFLVGPTLLAACGMPAPFGPYGAPTWRTTLAVDARGRAVPFRPRLSAVSRLGARRGLASRFPGAAASRATRTREADARPQ